MRSRSGQVESVTIESQIVHVYIVVVRVILIRVYQFYHQELRCYPLLQLHLPLALCSVREHHQHWEAVQLSNTHFLL